MSNRKSALRQLVNQRLDALPENPPNKPNRTGEAVVRGKERSRTGEAVVRGKERSRTGDAVVRSS
jgi:hypothetical protein